MEQSVAKAFHLRLQSWSRFNDPFHLGSSLEFSMVLAPTGLLGSGIFVLGFVCLALSFEVRARPVFYH